MVDRMPSLLATKNSDDEMERATTKKVMRTNRRAPLKRDSSNNMRASLRDVRHSSTFASTRMLQIAPCNDGSDSSLNTSGLSSEDISKFTVKSPFGNNTTSTANNSSSFLNSSSSSMVEGGSKIRKKNRSGRISELRREMSQSRLQKVNGAAAVGDETASNPTHLLRSPSMRRSQKRLASFVSKAPSIKTDDGTSTVIETTWKRNSRKALSSSASEAASSPNPQEERKKRGVRKGGAMRNILRNKHRLERELHRSDIFHFVLHKQQQATIVGNHDNHPTATNSMTSNQSSNDTSSGERNRRRGRRHMSLDKFLRMKQQSELLASNHEKLSQHTKESDIWGLDTERNEKENDKDMDDGDNEEEEEEFHEEDEDENQNSACSLDFWEAINDQKKDSKLISHESGSTAMSEELDSQTLSLEELHLEEDMSGHSVESVTDYAVVDPAGNRGIYSGKISKSSSMPCGQGRLEYPDRGLIYEGQFAHGYWTGYGRCINTQTGEDYTGTFLDNIRHGHGITKYQDGRIFEGSYNNGVKTEGKMTYQDGSTYLGHWSNGARHGRGTYTFANGSVYIGEFENDQMHGSGVLTWSNGTRFVGHWKNGRRHGAGKEFRPNGAIHREGTWNEGTYVRS